MFVFPRRKDRSPAPAFAPRVEALEARETPAVVANPDNYQVGAGQVLTVPVNQGVLINDFNDTNPGAILSSSLVVGAKYTGAGAPPLPAGSLNLSQNGSFTFIAPSNFNPNYGNVTFQYRATDRDTGENATTTVTISINGVAGQGQQKLYAIASGPGTAPLVRVFDAVTGVEKFNFQPYEASFTGGVRVATGDLNHDGVDDVAVVPASGGSPRVEVYDGKTGTKIDDFFAYEPTFRGGADVAMGDVNGDGYNDLIVGAGEGGGPRVLVFDGKNAGSLTTPTASNLSSSVLLDFFAYEPSFRSGVQVAAGDLAGLRQTDPTNSRDYIVTGTFSGGGPVVRVFDPVQVKNNQQIGIGAPAPLTSFFAFDPNSRDGVNVAVGQFRSDGKADIVTGNGAGTPDVRVFDGRTYTQLREFGVPTDNNPSGGTAPTGGQSGGTGGGTGSLFQSGNGTSPGTTTGAQGTLFTGGSGSGGGSTGGARVAVTPRSGNGLSDIVVGLGPGYSPTVRIFDGNSLQELENFVGFSNDFLGGVYVGGNSLKQ